MSKTPPYQIRADYDKDSIVVYQAYREAIGKPAIENNAFKPPFSFNRMTWIKPSFLWMMERSKAVLTHPEKSIYPNAEAWSKQFEKAAVHVQWDPERSIYGKKQAYYSIQVGISRHLIQAYAESWVIKIEDMRPLVRKIHNLCKAGQYENAKKLLPSERVYPVSDEIAHRIGVSW